MSLQEYYTLAEGYIYILKNASTNNYHISECLDKLYEIRSSLSAHHSENKRYKVIMDQIDDIIESYSYSSEGEEDKEECEEEEDEEEESEDEESEDEESEEEEEEEEKKDNSSLKMHTMLSLFFLSVYSYSLATWVFTHCA